MKSNLYFLLMSASVVFSGAAIAQVEQVLNESKQTFAAAQSDIFGERQMPRVGMEPAVQRIPAFDEITEAQDKAATSSDAGRFTIVGMHVDNTRQPKDLFKTAAECANNERCMAVAAAVGKAYKIPVDKIVVAAGALSSQSPDEGTFMTLSAPSGYRYCRASMSLTSIVPHDGPRGATFLGRADDTSLYSETWTPIRQFGEGRTWVEGDLTLIAVKAQYAEEEYQSGRCVKGGSRVWFYCRGSGCEGGAEDRGRSIDASSPPAAGSRK
jgi:hypothetical protein